VPIVGGWLGALDATSCFPQADPALLLPGEGLSDDPFSASNGAIYAVVLVKGLTGRAAKAARSFLDSTEMQYLSMNLAVLPIA
jgi:hypothetical protein